MPHNFVEPNRLIDELSPYLLQHAFNPVRWYPWGEEALSKAKAEDKPIFLSIGYSACHWCHVRKGADLQSSTNALSTCSQGGGGLMACTADSLVASSS